MGQCLEFVRGLLFEMVDSYAILVQFYSVLVLDQFSQRRKMRLKQAHPMPSRAKLFVFLEVTAVLR